MDELIAYFEKDLKAHLEKTFASSIEQDLIKKLNETEKAVFAYTDNYILDSPLIAKDVEPSVQRILDAFLKSKI